MMRNYVKEANKQNFLLKVHIFDDLKSHAFQLALGIPLPVFNTTL